jgi:hypothetical protein
MEGAGFRMGIVALLSRVPRVPFADANFTLGYSRTLLRSGRPMGFARRSSALVHQEFIRAQDEKRGTALADPLF